MFCVRNPYWEQWQTKFAQVSGTRVETWYDGSRAIHIPMDCYHSVDMQAQIDLWMKLAKPLEAAVADVAQGRWCEGYR